MLFFPINICFCGFPQKGFYYGYYYYYCFNISNSCKNARYKYFIFLLELIIKEFLAICCHTRFDQSLVGIVEVAKPSALFHLQTFSRPPVFNPVSYFPSAFPQPLPFPHCSGASNSRRCLVLYSLLPFLRAFLFMSVSAFLYLVPLLQPLSSENELTSS